MRLSTLKISLKQNERIYINGAVMRFDRKTSLEFLNDVQFLLESHIIQAEDADTPLKRLYFTIQLQLMSPKDTASTLELFNNQLVGLLYTIDDHIIRNELKNIDRLVRELRLHEAMKTLRALLPAERRLMESNSNSLSIDETDTLQVTSG